MEITREFKEKTRTAILAARQNFGGSDAEFAKSIGLNGSVYSRLKNGEVEKIISEMQWITIGRQLQVNATGDNWKIVRTSVYNELEDSLKFCKEFSKAILFVDEPDIGKTVCSRHILSTMKNAFYVDCSQAKTRQQFIRLIAKTVGVDHQGKYIDVKANLKYALTVLDKPIIVLDEAGDLEYTAFLEIKELWNGTEGACGWFMMGADGLRAKIEKGRNSNKVGYAEILSRFSDDYVKLVPLGKDDRRAFFTELIGTVAKANIENKENIPRLVKQCLDKEKKLRFLKTTIQLSA